MLAMDQDKAVFKGKEKNILYSPSRVEQGRGREFCFFLSDAAVVEATAAEAEAQRRAFDLSGLGKRKRKEEEARLWERKRSRN